MKKTLLIVFSLISLVIVSVAFTTDDSPKYKNLKILPKNISRQEMDSTMHYYSRSLGVGCDFCHVHNQLRDTWDMAIDAKPEKLIARKMMLMTRGINAMYFPPEKGVKDQQLIQAVTCFTCHRGEAFPSDMPEIKKDSVNTK